MKRRAIFLVVVGLLAGCGGAELSDEAARELQEHTADIRTAAENRDLAAAEGALDRLRASLDQHMESGDVGARRAREIAAAAELVAERLALLSPDAADPPVGEAPRDAPTGEPAPVSPTPDDAAEDAAEEAEEEAEAAKKEAEKEAEAAKKEAEKEAEEAAEQAEDAADEAEADKE